MMNKSAESGHHCLIPDFIGKGFSFPHLVWWLVIYSLYYVEVHSFYS
jgi:hypothetical protein